MRRGRGDRALLWRHWAHLLIGGALLMPYFLLCTVVLQTAGVRGGPAPFGSLGWQLAAYGMSLPLIALTALLFPLVRGLETAAAEALCGLRPGTLAPGPARSAQARRRSAAWFALHTGLGTLVAGASLAVPPLAVSLLALPFTAALRDAAVMSPYGVLAEPTPWLSPVYGLAMLALLAAAVRGAGAVLARCAPALLGPTPADRLAAAEARAARLAERNRLARELHDSVGHALSAVTLQAAAARRVLDADPAFVREALAAIEETTGEAVAELDAVLGLLREEDASRSAPDPGPQSDRPENPASPAIEDAGRSPARGRVSVELQRLLDRTRAAGLHAECTAPDAADLDRLPRQVAHATHRIAQEALGNALRHAPDQPLHLRLTVTDEELTLTMENPLPEPWSGRPPRPGGGRGLRGLAERAALLGGTATAGPQDGVWRLTARLPLPATEHDR